MIKVLFFAQLQEEIGSGQLELSEKLKSVGELKTYIEAHYPSVNLKQVMTAVNEEFALDNEVLQEGDIVAFLPPVSGG